jgi:hypothetical protein
LRWNAVEYGKRYFISPGASLMPVHDWSRVQAGTFHDFHSGWIIHLKEKMNGGLLPGGYYALSEQHVGRRIDDVLALHAPEASASPVLHRTLTIRSVEGHRIVALVEILSPGNKDRAASIEEFVEKVDSALKAGIHVLVIDLFGPSRFDSQGIHGAIWAEFDSAIYDLPEREPLTLASYEAGVMPEAYVEHLALGDPLPDIPLFLDIGTYINVPLEPTYQTAFRGMPAIYRTLLERKEA